MSLPAFLAIAAALFVVTIAMLMLVMERLVERGLVAFLGGFLAMVLAASFLFANLPAIFGMCGNGVECRSAHQRINDLEGAEKRRSSPAESLP